MDTIGDAVKFEVERYARSLLLSNALLLAAQRGVLVGKQITTYVSGILFQIRGSLGVLKRAEEVACASGDQALASHYRHKYSEEYGHDRWAERDLKALRGSFDLYESNRSLTALKKLIAYLGNVVDRDPCLFLSYLLLSEYLTVLVGPVWLQALEGKCGVPRNNLSVVVNHVELDRAHVKDGIREIDALVCTRDKRDAMLEVVQRSVAYYDEFWDEILGTTTIAA